MIRTTFFTYADPVYELFVLPYIVSVLIHNHDARVEICLDDSEKYRDSNTEAVDVLLQNFGEGRFMLRDAERNADVSPNSVRFLETPREMTEFTYIGDIDILILEAVSRFHIERMKRFSFEYSNIKRSKKDKLSGLHFTRSDAYYPVHIPTGTNLHLDEALLYTMVVSRGHPLPPSDWSRPVHGYHLSPNRSPYASVLNDSKIPPWGGIESRVYLRAYRKLQRHAAWKAMYPFFDKRYRLLLGLLDIALSRTHRFYRSNRSGQVTDLLTDPTLIKSILAIR